MHGVMTRYRNAKYGVQLISRGTESSLSREACVLSGRFPPSYVNSTRGLMEGANRNTVKTVVV